MVKKKRTKILSLFIAAIMLLGAMPMSAMAAPNSDIPSEMLDNVFLDALAYIGYDVQAAKNDGSIFVKYSSSVSSSILSNIGYDQGPSGLETVANSNTATGLAPNIAKYESSGLCCASYVSYVYYNYLPNIAGVDTSSNPRPDIPRLAAAYYQQAQKWVSDGTARWINFTLGSDGSFQPSEEIPIGALMIYKAGNEDRISHVALYAGYYNGKHFVTHVGNERGPEISMVYNSKGGTQNILVAVAVPQFVEENGAIEVYKKDTDGKQLSGTRKERTRTMSNERDYAETETEFNEYVAKCKELSLYDTGVTAEYGDKLITLSTCEYSQTNGRIVVVAKLIK